MYVCVGDKNNPGHKHKAETNILRVHKIVGES